MKCGQTEKATEKVSLCSQPVKETNISEVCFENAKVLILYLLENIENDLYWSQISLIF